MRERRPGLYLHGMLIGVSRVPEWLRQLREGADGDAVYLTDGLRLFRVVGAMTPDGGPCVHLEDCYTLSEALYTPGELWEMQLRTVGYRVPVPA
jgi:hypothetical protein